MHYSSWFQRFNIFEIVDISLDILDLSSAHGKKCPAVGQEQLTTYLDNREVQIWGSCSCSIVLDEYVRIWLGPVLRIHFLPGFFCLCCLQISINVFKHVQLREVYHFQFWYQFYFNNCFHLKEIQMYIKEVNRRWGCHQERWAWVWWYSSHW